MANSESFEPMQVDAAEENDNDGDLSIAAYQHHMDGVANGISASGGPIIPPALIPSGKYRLQSFVLL